MSSSARYLSPSEAAKQLGVSAKALRLYEERGLLAPSRTQAGWRVYGPEQMARASRIVALRALGLGLGHVGRVLTGEPRELEAALVAHQAALEEQMRALAGATDRVRAMRAALVAGQAPDAEARAPAIGRHVAFELPWPWGGERFELRDIRPLTYSIGPLGSGKTRLARRLAEALADAAFLGLDRLDDDGAGARARLSDDPDLKSRVHRTLGRLVEDGAAASDALVSLLVGLEAEGPAILVIDMLEQGLDKATQEALISYLRQRGAAARPLFALTRSSAILDLESVGAEETILLCPANHSPPTRVAPFRGAPGYEAVATCLAPPDVRARTEGVVAWLPRRA